ncbi:hypothetical protein COLO4_19708 [Corchorus olitorius]|uniref:Uncharacterized protein n=1 Tax=Corchorus olitorius TaxID=93759 RepID=A0A1R3J3X4_9ROSI|nr:hypothetical protein COLO4_19708 [Corchorus olitorius]
MSSSTPDVSSTPHQPGIGSSTNPDQATEETNPANTHTVGEGLDEEGVPDKKRAKTSTIWEEFKDVNSNGCTRSKKQEQIWLKFGMLYMRSMKIMLVSINMAMNIVLN